MGQEGHKNFRIHKMKIGYLTHDMNPNAGWGRYASDLISGIKNAGHDVVILKEADDGYEGIVVLKRKLRLFISAFQIIKYLKDCDIIHALDVYPYGVIAWLANIFLKKRLIITAIGTYSIAPFYNLKTRFLTRAAVRRADTIISISDYTKKELLKCTTVRKIEVINPSVNFDNFYIPRQQTNEYYILSVGALKFRKGYHVSIPAFALVKKEMPGLRYKIVGSQKDTNYFALLKKLVKDYGVEDSIEFLQNVSDGELDELYSKAYAFILPSINQGHHFEGFGLVFLEAAAVGLPVVGTLGNGIEDAVNDGRNGILVPQNNIQKTAEAIITILSNLKNWQRMSDESYQWAKEHNTSIIIQKYLSLYKQI